MNLDTFLFVVKNSLKELFPGFKDVFPRLLISISLFPV